MNIRNHISAFLQQSAYIAELQKDAISPTSETGKRILDSETHDGRFCVICTIGIDVCEYLNGDNLTEDYFLLTIVPSEGNCNVFDMCDAREVHVMLRMLLPIAKYSPTKTLLAVAQEVSDFMNCR